MHKILKKIPILSGTNVNTTEAASALLKQLNTSEEFSAGAKKIASFFRASEEHLSPGELLITLLGTQIPQKLQEYFLFSIFDVGVSDFDLMISLKRLQRLSRLFGRLSLFPDTLSELEIEIIQSIQQGSPIRNIDELNIARAIISNWVEMFIEQKEIGSQRRIQVALLYKCEARALRARSDWLSEHADTYNMKTMVRLLPLISACDESAKTIIDLAEHIENGKMPGTPTLNFELAMKTDAFEKWLKKLSKQPECALFFQAINEQRSKRVPNRLLIAASTLTRAIQNSTAAPLSWIAQAIGCCTSSGFTIDTETQNSSLASLLNQSGVEIKGKTIIGDFLKNSFSQLVGDDNLTLSITDSRELTINEIVNKCMRNDTMLARLLDNPKVYNTPGLVQRIASSSHSMSILHKIALTRELHTGQANNGVPLALLKNPTRIPITLLRVFINPRHTSIFEMKDLIRSPYGIRREVYDEVKAFIDSRH